MLALLNSFRESPCGSDTGECHDLTHNATPSKRYSLSSLALLLSVAASITESSSSEGTFGDHLV